MRTYRREPKFVQMDIDMTVKRLSAVPVGFRDRIIIGTWEELPLWRKAMKSAGFTVRRCGPYEPSSQAYPQFLVKKISA